MQHSILFIDMPNLCIRTLFGDPEMYKNPSPIFDQHKHILLTTIFSNIKKFCPDEVIICSDDKKSWRKKYYSEYKANRKEKRDIDLFPWPVYYAYIDSFIEELKEIFPFKFIKIPYSEADDVIAILSRHLTTSINTIITTDSDFIQLLQSKNIRLYDPLKKRQIIDSDPNKTLQIKILAGDHGDNVPAIKDRVGPKTAIKILDTNQLETLLQDETIKANYIRNQKLIDLNNIPDIIKKETLKVYDDYKQLNNFNVNEVLKFLVKHKLRKLTEDLSIIKNLMQPLIGNKTMKEFF